MYKKDTKLNGENPTILYGYGGFNISLKPSFTVTNAVWLENGGIYAVANLRGGGEYGKKWHDSGTKMKKQNVFDDFIAAAEFLIEKHGWDAKLLKKFTVAELRIAKETGKLPTEEMEKRKRSADTRNGVMCGKRGR